MGASGGKFADDNLDLDSMLDPLNQFSDGFDLGAIVDPFDQFSDPSASGFLDPLGNAKKRNRPRGKGIAATVREIVKKEQDKKARAWSRKMAKADMIDRNASMKAETLRKPYEAKRKREVLPQDLSETDALPNLSNYLGL